MVVAVAVQAGGVRLAGLVSVAVAGQAVFAALFRIGGAQIAAFLPFDLIRGQGFSAAMAGAAMQTWHVSRTESRPLA